MAVNWDFSQDPTNIDPSNGWDFSATPSDVQSTEQQAQSAYQKREANPAQARSDVLGSTIGGLGESIYKGSYIEGLADRLRGMSPKDQFVQNVRYGHVTPTAADIEKYGLTSDDLVQNQVNSGKAQGIAHGVGQFAGGMAPWLAAGALTGGAADVVGLGAEAMEGAPLVARLAAALGRGAVQGAGVTGWEALTGNKPTSKELLQNMAFGGAADIAGTAAGAAGQALKLPAVITRPVGAFVGGTAGALASGQPNPLKQGATLGAVEAALTALGGRGAFMPASAEESGVLDTTPPQAETIPGTIGTVVPEKPTATEAPAAKPTVTFNGNTFTEDDLNEHRAILEQEQKKMIDGMTEQILTGRSAQSETDIYRTIQQKGGIAPDPTKDLSEERKKIPLGLRNKNGLPLDEMADEFGMTENGLLEAIGNRTPLGKMTNEEARSQAESLLVRNEKYQAIQTTLGNIDTLNKQLQQGQKEPWQMTQDEYLAQDVQNRAAAGQAPYGDQAALDHEDAVRQAITDGKPVPEEVMKDYPGIASVQSLDQNVQDPPLHEGMGAATWKPGDPTVDTSPMNLRLLNTDKTTSRDWRQELSSKRNAQVQRGNQVCDAIANFLKRTKEDPAGEEEIAYIIRDTKNDKGMMQKILALPYQHVQDLLDRVMPDGSKLTYRQGLEQAIQGLSGKGIEGEALANQLYDEVKDRSVALGTIGRGDPSFQGIEDYVNRIYKSRTKQDYVKTETGRRGLSAYTSHSKERVFPTVFHAYLGLDENLKPILDDEGKVVGTVREPATMKLSKAARILNEEMAKTNTNMEFQDAAHDLGMGKWTTGQIPDGFKDTGLQKHIAVTDKSGKPLALTQKFVMPEGIVNGMAAVLEPNFITKIDPLRKLNRYQGYVKTIDLAYSAFHHTTMFAQMLYQSKGGMDLLMNYGRLKGLMDDGTYNQAEQLFVRRTGMVEPLRENMDAFRSLTTGDDTLAKIARTPGIKQLAQGAELSRNFLFGKLQRWLKVMDFYNKNMKYISAHPDISDEDLIQAQRGIAREVNDAYGGLNWEALGVTPSMQTLLRTMFLAPDWTVSNYNLFVDATGNWKGPENAAAGKAARSHIATALIAGGVLTEGLNYILTGHYTDKNPKGHETEVEVSPGVYVSLFRGGIGDGLKLASDIIRFGPQGAAMFAQGKLSPWARTAVGLMSNTDYMGRKIASSTNSFAQNTASVATFIASEAAPVPFGGSNLSEYLFANKGPIQGLKQYAQTGQLPNEQITPEGLAAVGTGIGTYSTPPNKGSVFDVPANEYKGNVIQQAEDVFNPQQGGMGQVQASMSAANKAKLAQDKALEEEIGQALVNNDKAAVPGIFKKYGTPANMQKTFLTNVNNKLNKRYVADYPYNYDVSQSLTSFYNNLDAMQTAATDQDTSGFSTSLLTYFTRQGKSLTAARKRLDTIDGSQKLTAAQKAQMEQNYQALMMRIADASNRHYQEWRQQQ